MGIKTHPIKRSNGTNWELFRRNIAE